MGESPVCGKRVGQAERNTVEKEENVMERLTKYDTDGQAMIDCQKCEADWTGKHGKPMADCTALYCRNRLLDRLVKYEDTGLEPEEVLPKDKADEIALKLMRLADLESLCSYTRLRELAEADKDGRLVVLPCKVGDMVYVINRHLGQIFASTVISINVGNSTDLKNYIRTKWVGKKGNESIRTWTLRQVGRYVFLTREEAEKALEAMKDK